LMNGKRPSAEAQGSEAGPSKKRRLTDDVPHINGSAARTSQPSQPSTNGKSNRPASQKAARKTATASAPRDVFDAPTVTGEQIPLARAVLTSVPLKTKGKRTSPFDSDSDDNAENEAPKKRPRKEMKTVEARFRFGKDEPAVRHVSPTQKRVSQIEIAHEVSVNLSRTAEDAQQEEQQEMPKQPARPATAVSAAGTSRKPLKQPGGSPPPVTPGPSIHVGLGIKLSPVRVDQVRLLGRSPRRKSGLDSPPGSAVLPPPAPPSVSALAAEVVPPPPQALVEVTATIETVQAPAAITERPVEVEAAPVIAAAAASSNVASARTPPPLLGGFKPTFTLDPKDTALCLTIADLGQILQEIDEYRAHGY